MMFVRSTKMVAVETNVQQAWLIGFGLLLLRVLRLWRQSLFDRAVTPVMTHPKTKLNT